MNQYFKNMTPLGKILSDKKKEQARINCQSIKEVEKILSNELERIKKLGISDEKIHSRGQMTIWDRIEYLVDKDTFRPLHTLYNPRQNKEGATGVIDGLAKISGKWCVIAGFDNKIMAGAWIPGQAENQLRITDLAKRLHIPLVWLVNCSGVKLPEQHEVYADRRGNGTTFFRHAELEKLGVPILAAIYGTNPAGGGYQGISPTFLIAHKDCNIAVGGGGIVSGMTPKGFFDLGGANDIIEATRHFKEVPPGSVNIHYNETGFFKEVCETEQGVLDSIKKYVDKLPSYNLDFFRVDIPKLPIFPMEDIYSLVAFNQKQVWNFEECLARLVDGSENIVFKPNYGYEIYCGLVKLNGLLVGIIANRQGFMPAGYPEYANGAYQGIGGKLYRQGLIKMNEFVTLCGRDRLPIIWFQDTSGIDIGDLAEKAELLGLGQSLIYSIEQTNVPMMLVVMRKGTAAAHYIMGGPTANNHNAFTLGTPLTEIYVMHGETAAVASFSRRLVKEKEAGNDLEPVINKMNQLAQEYYERSRPVYCAIRGFVDEVINLSELRNYMVAFTESAYQNPISICPHHHMILPRVIKG